MNNKTIHWDAENRIATVSIIDNDKIFTGTAKCHETDQDMCSEKTGIEIATQRVAINYLCHVRDNELQPALNALNQLYYSMNRSKNFSPKSYEAKMLYRAINRYTADLEAIKDEIKERRLILKAYINNKDKFYNQVREVRKKQALFAADKTE
jgi:hypothetical protein